MEGEGDHIYICISSHSHSEITWLTWITVSRFSGIQVDQAGDLFLGSEHEDLFGVVR